MISMTRHRTPTGEEHVNTRTGGRSSPDVTPGARGWSLTIRQLRRALVLAVALGSLGLAVAGCGGSSSDSSTSSGGSAGSSGGTPASSQTANSSKLAQFAQCMRAHGLSDFPDPTGGHLNLRITKGSDLNPNSPAYQTAFKACKSLEPAGLRSGARQNPQQQQQLLKFVNCMRSHGVANFPDPNANGTMLIQGGANGVDPNSPQFKSAMQACRSLIPAGAVGG